MRAVFGPVYMTGELWVHAGRLHELGVERLESAEGSDTRE
eukprot:gene15340-62857_t